MEPNVNLIIQVYAQSMKVGRATLITKSPQCKYATSLSSIAHCRNLRGLGRVSNIDYVENLTISTEMLLNEKLPSQV